MAEAQAHDLQSLTETSPVLGRRMTARRFAFMAEAYTLTHQELVGIIRYFQAKKGWKLDTIGIMAGLSSSQIIREFLAGRREASTTVKRLLWLLFIIDTRPALAMDPLSIATWGKLSRVPVSTDWSANADKLAAYLAGAHPRTHTARALGRRFRLPLTTVYYWCRKLNYPLKTRPYRRLSTDWRMLRDPWMTLDWRGTNMAVQKRSGISHFTVRWARCELRRRFSKARVKASMISHGVDAGKADEQVRWIFHHLECVNIAKRKTGRAVRKSVFKPTSHGCRIDRLLQRAPPALMQSQYPTETTLEPAEAVRAISRSCSSPKDFQAMG